MTHIREEEDWTFTDAADDVDGDGHCTVSFCG